VIARIIELSVRNKVLVLLFAAMLAGLGWQAWRKIRLDAIPDLSDVQVIVTTEFPGQNPQVVDSQVTYPLSAALLAVPGAYDVRGISMFEQSFVYVLFEDGTDIYWARGARPRVPVRRARAAAQGRRAEARPGRDRGRLGPAVRARRGRPR
jgi:Cu(I)/Ag(I) efflux system membrane protein CusA/SilA